MSRFPWQQTPFARVGMRSCSSLGPAPVRSLVCYLSVSYLCLSRCIVLKSHWLYLCVTKPDVLSPLVQVSGRFNWFCLTSEVLWLSLIHTAMGKEWRSRLGHFRMWLFSQSPASDLVRRTAGEFDYCSLRFSVSNTTAVSSFSLSPYQHQVVLVVQMWLKRNLDSVALATMALLL